MFLLQAALAAKRARELVRTKSVLKSSSLPGKLADCASSDPEESGALLLVPWNPCIISGSSSNLIDTILVGPSDLTSPWSSTLLLNICLTNVVYIFV